MASTGGDRRFPSALLAALGDARIIRVRSGPVHRFTAVWVVVVKRRVFARSWSDKPTGWFRAFLEEPRGTIQLPTSHNVRVLGKRVRGERMLDAISDAYAEKYPTAASKKWVRGFAQPRRRANTIEFVPR